MTTSLPRDGFLNPDGQIRAEIGRSVGFLGNPNPPIQFNSIQNPNHSGPKLNTFSPVSAEKK